MKRDFDLIRAILLDLQERGCFYSFELCKRMGITPDDVWRVNEHLRLMKEAGHIDSHTMWDGSHICIRIENHGYNFLAKIASPEIWQRIKDHAEAAGVLLTEEIILFIADKWAKERLSSGGMK